MALLMGLSSRRVWLYVATVCLVPSRGQEYRRC